MDNHNPPKTDSGVPPLHHNITMHYKNTVMIHCNYRSCLDQRSGQCTAKEIDVIDGRCISIVRSKDAMKSDVPPMERNARGALANKQRPG